MRALSPSTSTAPSPLTQRRPRARRTHLPAHTLRLAARAIAWARAHAELDALGLCETADATTERPETMRDGRAA